MISLVIIIVISHDWDLWWLEESSHISFGYGMLTQNVLLTNLNAILRKDKYNYYFKALVVIWSFVCLRVNLGGFVERYP